MKKKQQNIITYKDKADYSIKWETIYANSDITQEEIDEFKKQLEDEGYRILNVLKGTK